jgi:Protein of unknown function (DUF1496)
MLCVPAAAQSAPEPKPAAAPAALTCVYNSKNYSDGAHVCVTKNLMLTCAADSSQAVWNVATDKDVNDKCARPAVHLTKSQTRALWRRHNIYRQITPGTTPPPFCFGFDDGPLYCE